MVRTKNTYDTYVIWYCFGESDPYRHKFNFLKTPKKVCNKMEIFTLFIFS